jgi:hypothetical protein
MAFKRPTNGSRNRNAEAREPITLERAIAVCPDAQIAENISRRFALDPVDYEAVRDAHRRALGQMADSFGKSLGEKGAAMHFQRLVGALVGSALNAGNFYGQKVTEARDATSRLQNEHRDEDRDGVYAFESRAQRARRFAAEMGLQAYAQLAAADGAVSAYSEITGETWKPYVAPTDNSQAVDRQAATAELGAFGDA